MKFRTLFSVLSVILFGLAIFSSGFASEGKLMAKDFEAKTMNGKIVKLSDFRGKIVLLNFWASWCPPCLEEFPSLNELAKKFPEVVILAVNEGEKIEIVNEFRHRTGYSFIFLTDENFEIGKKYGISRIPRTFLIGKSGEIIEVVKGAIDWSHPQNIDEIRRLVTE
jgi:thiol-disulfide isomerase/thioredoxin